MLLNEREFLGLQLVEISPISCYLQEIASMPQMRLIRVIKKIYNFHATTTTTTKRNKKKHSVYLFCKLAQLV